MYGLQYCSVYSLCCLNLFSTHHPFFLFFEHFILCLRPYFPLHSAAQHGHPVHSLQSECSTFLARVVRRAIYSRYDNSVCVCVCVLFFTTSILFVCLAFIFYCILFLSRVRLFLSMCVCLCVWLYFAIFCFAVCVFFASLFCLLLLLAPSWPSRRQRGEVESKESEPESKSRTESLTFRSVCVCVYVYGCVCVCFSYVCLVLRAFPMFFSRSFSGFSFFPHTLFIYLPLAAASIFYIRSTLHSFALFFNPLSSSPSTAAPTLTATPTSPRVHIHL